MKLRLVLQVHDELVFEVPAQEVKVVAQMIKQEMENALLLSIPLVVDLKVGKNWDKM